MDGEQVVEIALTQQKVTLIDLEDWDLVRRFRWYAARTSAGKRLYAHASPLGGSNRSTKLGMHTLLMGHKWVDHEDENGLNNRRKNLRPCTNGQNQQNTDGRGGSSKFKGVSRVRKRGVWRVAFNWQGKTHFVGYFTNEDEAALAYNAAILPLAGEFARLNEVPDRIDSITSHTNP